MLRICNENVAQRNCNGKREHGLLIKPKPFASKNKIDIIIEIAIAVDNCYICANYFYDEEFSTRIAMAWFGS